MNDSHNPVTPVFLEDWASQAFRKRLELHFQITDPVLAVRERAFTLMSHLLLEAIGTVRTASAALRERDAQLAKGDKWGTESAKNEPRES